MSTHHFGTALITGASSGIGAIYAERMAQRGYDLILVARNRDRLTALAAKIADETGRSVEVIVADLNDHADVRRVADIFGSDLSITALINNAGVGATAPALQSDIGAMVRMIDLNVTALTTLTYAALPAFVTAKNGLIINISSAGAIAPEMLNGVYGGTKAFVLAFTQSLHKEVSGTGVQVQVVIPGATATEFWNAAGMPIHYLPAEIVMPAEEMVDAALAGLDQGELVTIPSLPDQADWHAFEQARQKLMPNLSRASVARRNQK